METSGDDDAFQDVPRNLPIPHANLPSSPLPPSSLPAGGTSPSRPPNLQTVIARLSPTKPVLSSHSKTKDGLIRMLLQSSPLQQAQLASGSSNTEQESQADATQGPGYIARLCGTERALSLIQLDHCYSKPWNWKPESSLCQPTKTLFVPRVSRNSTGIETPDHGDDLPDVVAEPLAPGPPYDPQQAYKVMNECDRFVSFANPRLCGAGDEEDLSGWEEAIPRDGWSAAQAKLFSKMMKVLTQDRLARLALEGQPNEPVLRRIAVDRAAKRARAVLAAPPCVWDRSLVQWLQGLLTARLPRPYLAAWLDILQTLRSHLPGLVDRLLAAPTGGFQLDSRARAVSREGLNLLLRRPWDPAATGLTRRRLARLPGNPVLVVAPPGPADPKLVSRRMRLWNNQLGCLGKVIVINMPPPRGEAGNRTPVGNYLYQMVSATLTKVREIKHAADARPVVLLGWGVGAAIAAHVAGMERLAGLVCLGFPISTLAGLRGQAGDPVLELKTPVLFVVGERSSQAGSDDVEDLRERLSVETALVIVGGADDGLRLSKKKKKAENVTQCMVDRCIMDEVRDFLHGLLSGRQPSFMLQAEPTFAVPNQEAAPPRKVKNRKRNSSDSTSSPLSPNKRRTPAQGPSTPNANPKKARRPKKSKSTESTPTNQLEAGHRLVPGTAVPGQTQLASSTLPVLPSPLARLALPASLLSISSPLPQVQQPDNGGTSSGGGGAATADPQQLSPPLLAVRPPASPLLSSALTTPRGPQRPHSPTPRVIQYAASRPKQPTGGLTLTSPKGQSSPTTPPKTPGQGALSPPAFGLLTAPTWSTTGSRAHSGGLLSIGQSAMGPRSQTSPMLRAQVVARPRHPGGGLQLCRPLANLQAHAAAHEIRMRAALSQARGLSSSPNNSPEKRLRESEGSTPNQSTTPASSPQKINVSKPDGAAS